MIISSSSKNLWSLGCEWSTAFGKGGLSLIEKAATDLIINAHFIILNQLDRWYEACIVFSLWTRNTYFEDICDLFSDYTHLNIIKIL
jgi:hypothetical protein